MLLRGPIKLLRVKTIVSLAATFSVGVMFLSFSVPGRIQQVVDSDEPHRDIRPDNYQPLILMWTPVFGKTATDMNCNDVVCFGRKKYCEVTDKRDALSEASVILFHARDLRLNDLPQVKFTGQKWILWNHEPPRQSPTMVLAQADGLFDLIMSYQGDVDIPVPYGYISNLTRNPAHFEFDEEEMRVRFSKRKGAVWLVSSCYTESNREEYVAELQKHFSVDVYGKCGTLSCPYASEDFCMGEFSEKYMFYLAFENSICKDYVTEKLFRGMRYPIIPVTFSSQLSTELSSLNAFIQGTDYTPEQLAVELKRIASDFETYSSFFKWKHHFNAHHTEHSICHLCAAIRRGIKGYPKRNLRSWFLNQSCKSWDSKTARLVPSSKRCPGAVCPGDFWWGSNRLW